MIGKLLVARDIVDVGARRGRSDCKSSQVENRGITIEENQSTLKHF